MKRPIYILTLAALLATGATWVATDLPAPAMAAEDSHAGHNHGQETEEVPSSGHDDMEDLFDEEEDDHAGHDDHKGRDEHEGHGHAEEADAHDNHEEHGQEEEDAGHEGHGHGKKGEICPEHRVLEELDALCSGGHIGELQPGEGMKVRLADAEVAAKAGIRLTTPQSVTLAGGIQLPGRVEFNRNRLSRITPLAPGVVRQVSVQPGSRVEKGEVLAQIAMPEIASLKAQYLAAQAQKDQAQASFTREKDLLERGISSRLEFQQARAEHLAAQSDAEQYRQQLLNFGLSAGQIEQLVNRGDSSAVLKLRAPFGGEVVEVKTAVGEAVAPGTPLFTIADLDTLWVELSIPESRIYQAQIDAPIQASFDGLPGTLFKGRIFQVGALVDERTRTLKALAAVKNPGHRLKAGMFGQVRLLEGGEGQRLAIPADALQSIDGLPYVFIQQEADLFELRRVKTGAKIEGLVSILAGLSADDRVVSGQGFALKSEVLEARLGASCADH